MPEARAIKAVLLVQGREFLIRTTKPEMVDIASKAHARVDGFAQVIGSDDGREYLVRYADIGAWWIRG